MKNKYLVLIFLFFIGSAIWKTSSSFAFYKTSESELTTLMKSVYKKTIEMKEAIQRKESLPSISFKKYKKIYTATATDPEVKTKLFEEYTDTYLASLQKLYSQPTEDNYKLIIVECVKCHQEYCPGPLKKINQLNLN